MLKSRDLSKLSNWRFRCLKECGCWPERKVTADDAWEEQICYSDCHSDCSDVENPILSRFCYNDCPCKCARTCLGFCEDHDLGDSCRKSCGCDLPKCQPECRDQCLNRENLEKSSILRCFADCGCDGKKHAKPVLFLLDADYALSTIRIGSSDSNQGVFWSVLGIVLISGFACYLMYVFL